MVLLRKLDFFDAAVDFGDELGVVVVEEGSEAAQPVKEAEPVR